MVKSIEQLLSGRYEYSVTPPTVTPAGIDVTAEEGKDEPIAESLVRARERQY